MHPADAQRTWTRGWHRTDADSHSPVGKLTLHKLTLHLYVQKWHWFYKVVRDRGRLPCCEEICTQMDFTPFVKQSDYSLWLHNTNKGFNYPHYRSVILSNKMYMNKNVVHKKSTKRKEFQLKLWFPFSSIHDTSGSYWLKAMRNQILLIKCNFHISMVCLLWHVYLIL